MSEIKPSINGGEMVMYIDNFGRIRNDDYLMHHGILGQKWGKVNGPPYPLGAGDHSAAENRAGWTSSLTPKRRAQMDKALKKINKQQKRRYMPQYDVDTISNTERSSEYYEKEHTVPKGTVLYRTSTKDNETRKGSTLYVSQFEPERNLYKGGYVKNYNKAKDTYEYVMEASKDIKVPSREKLYSTINQAINENQGLLNKTIEARLKLFGVKVGAKEGDGYKYKKQDVERITQSALDQYKGMNLNQAAFFAAESFGENKQLRDIVVKKLKAEGYNAMRDEASVGGQSRVGAQGIDPLILFDDRSVKTSKVNKVTGKERTASADKYYEWKDKRDREIRTRNNLISSLYTRGYTQSEIAERLGISRATVQDALS